MSDSKDHNENTFAPEANELKKELDTADTPFASKPVRQAPPVESLKASAEPLDMQVNQEGFPHSDSGADA